ncbi:hypothetical protein SPRG_05072 [Saprolegnia parasitica CBS 223.65]|uniref:FAD dependent oxidoreductase domain-containing protein n=1 Tax=Saprolegnia parasitica (strain CBS 223.65) TaxID=695850 RepID=A0A067CV12_SAPPC|nr:hypothetical protein SPRG_05072 [Saprolegnia parasitica CBS 223.65]KDO30361.1 hypothetical protein SPRG_05072 [Saprolegnia parasitica CBS 223.65]|eukprot:XP_012198971.1 hypothetical protein SPRG_05072 [Saprolegnia parasitica CBS 223.65]
MTTTTTDYDVIVLGVGAMGSSACYHLAKRGQRVLGLEQFGPAHCRGSSHGKTRMVRKAYFEHPDYVPLLRRSYELWDELGASVGRPLFHRSGVVIFGPETKTNADDVNVLDGVQASAKKHNLPLEVLSRDACHARFPYFHVPEGYIGLFEADAGYVEVEASVAAHIEQARKLGADLRFDEAVLAWDVTSANTVSVRTASGTYKAAKLVVTTGAWSSSVLRSASLDLKVHRVPLFWFAPAPTDNGRALAATPNMPCFAIDLPCGFVYGFPYVDGDGVKIAPHLPGAVLDDPSALHPGVLPGELDAVAECVSTCFPGLLPAPTTSATCMYTMSRDGHFIIDTHPAHPNVVFAAGFSGHGYKFAPVIGEILSDLAMHGSTDHPIGFLRRR